MMTVAEQLKRKALELGFIKAGITTADNLDFYYDDVSRREYYAAWSRRRGQFIQNSLLQELVPEAKSILSVAYGYMNVAYPETLRQHIGRAYLARCYEPAAGIAKARLSLMRTYIESLGIRVFDIELPERAVAARAGVISYGKNNFAYVDGYGSFVILNSFVLDAVLEYDEPTIACHCPPNCNACMRACPTQAIESPGHLHPQRCIGYLNWMTQEEKHNDAVIAEELRPLIGTRLHGCDYCQEACPRNRRILNAGAAADPFLEKLAEEFDLERILDMTDEYYHAVVQPIMYNYISDYRYFRRNAAIVMANSKDAAYLPALKKAAADADPVVADAARWAVRQLE